MKNSSYFVKRILIFCIPFCAYLGIILLIDPYNYFNISRFTSKEKKGITNSLNYCFWKAIEFKNNPSQNIIIGDSRADNIDVDRIYRLTGESYFNFGYGGGSLPEMIKTFWYSVKITKLKRVYFFFLLY